MPLRGRRKRGDSKKTFLRGKEEEQKLRLYSAKADFRSRKKKILKGKKKSGDCGATVPCMYKRKKGGTTHGGEGEGNGSAQKMRMSSLFSHACSSSCECVRAVTTMGQLQKVSWKKEEGKENRIPFFCFCFEKRC